MATELVKVALQRFALRFNMYSTTIQCQQFYSSKVPDKSTNSSKSLDKNQIGEINLALVEQLERISLVELNNESGLQLLQNAVKAATKLHEVNTEGVEPLVSVLEDRELWLRPDGVTEGNCVNEILQNATITEEQYFVAPPGNIPLKKKSKDHLSKLLNTESNKTAS